MAGCIARTVVCDVGAFGRADAATVEVLARLCLAARRRDQRVLLRGASPDLRALLRLSGLADVVLGLGAPADGAGGSGAEPGRQAEQREQPGGVEERVHRDDAAT